MYGLSEADLYKGRRAVALKVGRACVVSVSDFGTLGLLVKEPDRALRASALGLRLPAAADQFHVADDAVAAHMGGDGEIVDGADLGGVFHF
jgi:hypothetical protein